MRKFVAPIVAPAVAAAVAAAPAAALFRLTYTLVTAWLWGAA
jgi:hypothetical protein